MVEHLTRNEDVHGSTPCSGSNILQGLKGLLDAGRVLFCERAEQQIPFWEEAGMNDIRDHFLCDSCANRDFKLVYNFSLRFHKVNFSDDLICDEMIVEQYECTKCLKTFTKKQIEEGLAELRKKRGGGFSPAPILPGS